MPIDSYNSIQVANKENEVSDKSPEVLLTRLARAEDLLNVHENITQVVKNLKPEGYISGFPKTLDAFSKLVSDGSSDAEKDTARQHIFKHLKKYQTPFVNIYLANSSKDIATAKNELINLVAEIYKSKIQGNINPFVDSVIRKDFSELVEDTGIATDKEITRTSIERKCLDYKSKIEILKSGKNTALGILKVEVQMLVSRLYNPKVQIMGTPFDEELVQGIIDAKNRTENIAGVLVYGPPGTGKTQLIHEANLQMGLGSRSTSVDRSTGQELLGETTVQISNPNSDRPHKAEVVQGELLTTIDNGQTPFLDEVDQVDPKYFKAFAAFLGSKKGFTYERDSLRKVIPTWANVDATSNSVDIPDWLKDRFSPNTKYIGYSPAEDLLEKATVWVAEVGKPLSLEAQSKLIATLTYIVPRLQDLYASGEISFPMTLRNIKTICKEVARGQDIATVIYEQILDPGALVTEGYQLNAVRNALNDFTPIRRGKPRISGEQMEEEVADYSVLEFASSYPYLSTPRGLNLTQLTLSQTESASLKRFESRKAIMVNGSAICTTGLQVRALPSDRYLVNGGIQVLGDDFETVLFEIPFEKNGNKNEVNPVISSIDNMGRTVICKTYSKTDKLEIGYGVMILLDRGIQMSLDSIYNAIPSIIDITVSGNGKYIIVEHNVGNLRERTGNAKGISILSVENLIAYTSEKKNEPSSNLELAFSPVRIIGEASGAIQSYKLNRDGTVALIVGTKGESYFINLNKEIGNTYNKNSINLRGDSIDLGSTDFEFIGNSLIYSKSQNKLYAIQ
ncbi:MAG: AAA family ATPase [bacterium]